MRNGASRALWLAIFLSVLIAGCARDDVPVASPPAVSAGAPMWATSSSSVHSEAGSEPIVNQDAPPRKKGITVKITPSTPPRTSPPVLQVGNAPLETDREFRSVRWLVSGREYSGRERLDPEIFHKGDRIRAGGTIRIGGEEISFETLEVVAGNTPPEIGDVRLEPKALTTGGTVKAVAAGTDPDGDPVRMRFTWFVDDKEVPGEGEQMVLSGVKKGSWIHVRVSTHDGTAEGSWKYSPKYLVVNSLPVVKSRPPEEIPPDRRFSYRIEAEDPDGDPLSYDLVKSPPGMVLSGSTLEWEVPEDVFGKTLEVVVAISDGDGGKTVCTLTMIIHPRNSG
jgi:hypothetical protein